ncbi:putative protein serine/threonine phosphatase [Megalodesulfovibrio gigas DSM 1382 = ATCC 19364]|uniref:PPM-type phosphatase domain-containing protein n=1 Tax=Megalodesulfovibrio gigas (strain ATCC 19364 / DSM 1382 / NCIMB 9332 / VKM B-1759) TaxID=1121448 RepID=T2GB74_MEGG1|nr:putative protein serine/threonine phosphatase [Megalodesulfovibrio gigas DSM 1382 = ATCC 19364]
MVESHGITDVGLHRSRNEDCLLMDDGLGLYVVADGMGGHQAGEVAAQLAVRTIHQHMLHMQAAESAASGPDSQRDPSLSVAANEVRTAILAANRAVLARAQDSPELQGMGTTVAVVYLRGNVLVAANVGDSPIYLLRGGVLRELSVAHTVATEQAALGRRLPESLREKLGHMLTRAVGTREVVTPDFFETFPRHNDVLLLCSDGLAGTVRREELQNVLLRHTPRRACEALLALALARGGEDNITCLAVRLQVQERGGIRSGAA